MNYKVNNNNKLNINLNKLKIIKNNKVATNIIIKHLINL